MHTLIDQVRRYECTGLVRRMTGYLFLRLLRKEEQVCGCVFVHANTGKEITFHGKVIVASGGLNGMFGNATGSVRNTGAVSASLFADGVAFANGEFIRVSPYDCSHAWKTSADYGGSSWRKWTTVRPARWKTFLFHGGKVS